MQFFKDIMGLKNFLILPLLLAGLCLSAGNLPRPEYPRPQFERREWRNLNGEWDFETDEADNGKEKNFASASSFKDKIIVPFCPESKLSGVEHKDFMNHVWYHRQFTVPESWTGKDILLNFGAVFYISEIYIDGKFAMRHFGGSSSFSVDITSLVTPGQTHHLVVKASSDVRTCKYPGGKQSTRIGSYDCNYTRTTGIWQTVWLEPVARTGLKSVHVTTDIDAGNIVVAPQFRSIAGQQLKVSVKDGDRTVSEKTVPASDNSVIVLPVKKMKLWSPESPFLYDIEYEVTEKDGEVTDKVCGYAGMRKIHIEGNRIHLNNQPYYQRLVLDQGFYPEGLWTAPSDEALRHDIELSKAAGFNGGRLHQKVFEERYHYWADRLGYLTWGEAPSWGMDANDLEAGYNFTEEWCSIVLRDRNHPSIVTWVPLNEEFWPDRWQYPRFVSGLYHITKAIDPTRPVNTVSGGVHVETDIWSVHTYEQNPQALGSLLVNDEKRMFEMPVVPLAPAKRNTGFNERPDYNQYAFAVYDGKIPYIVDEFGGVKWVMPERREGNDAAAWGYGNAPATRQEFLDRISGMVDTILSLDEYIWGYCYTQLTDVEQEQNGLYNYDRTPKFTASELSEIFSRNPQKQ